MVPKHICTQQTKISRLELAIFGDEVLGEKGMLELVKDINQKTDEMLPTYNEINNWSTFFKKGKELGVGLVVIITGIGIVMGALYSIKDWLKK